MENNQQTVTKPSADEQRKSPAESPVAGDGTPETNLQIENEKLRKELERVDNNRRTAVNKANKLQTDYDKLRGEHDTLISERESLSVALKAQYTDESLRNSVLKHAKDTADLAVAKLKFDREYKEFENMLSEKAKENLNSMADRLIKEYNVPVEKHSELKDISDPDRMELYAFKNRGQVAQEEKPAEQPDTKDTQAQKQEPPLMPGGGGANDSVLWKNFGQPGYRPTPAETKQAYILLQKAISGG